MRATEFLDNSRTLHILIKSTKETLDNLLYPRVSYEANGSKNPSNNAEQERQIKRYELGKKLNEYLDDLFCYRLALVGLLQDGKLTGHEKIILEQRYILAKSWKEVAAFIGFSEAQTKRINADLIADVATQPDFWRGLPKI